MTQNAKESLRASTLATLTAGGKDYRFIPCLNDHNAWIGALRDITQQHLQGWPTQP